MGSRKLPFTYLFDEDSPPITRTSGPVQNTSELQIACRRKLVGSNLPLSCRWVSRSLRRDVAYRLYLLGIDEGLIISSINISYTSRDISSWLDNGGLRGVWRIGVVPRYLREIV